MNNVTQNPSFVDYPTLDIATLRLSASDAGNAGIEVRRLFIQTNYLPNLHSRVTELDGAMREAVFKLREVASIIHTKLLINTETLDEYHAELDSASDLDREEILEDISKQAAKIVNVVNKGHTELQRLLVPMKPPVDRAATRQYLTQLAAEQERLPTEIQEIKSRTETLAQQRQTLTEAMALIEAKGFAQVGKDTLLNAQEIAKLGMAGPEVAMVEKAIELAQQLMEKLETVINYLGLMEARNLLRTQMDDLLARTHDKTDELRITGMKRDLITASHDFDDYRNLYVAEFEKIIGAEQSFLNVYRAVAEEDEQAITQLGLDARALASYLTAIA